MNQQNFSKKNDQSVDIIMPNYNKDLYLEESLNSILLQKYKNWNLIVIDDVKEGEELTVRYTFYKI